ncbi:MAG: 30S ribosomal protein S4 [bacterium]|nr:30S ribosomal protein S4 [bacterium]
MINACEKCRREGEKLLLKGEKCLSPKCTFIKRPYAPGDHGQGFRGKQSEYGRQLREKQKARRIYGISESQFSRYVEKANSLAGNNSENLIRLLETRADNVVYRLGFASSRSMARQFVSHGLFNVNGQKIKTPSLQVSVGVSIEPRKKEMFKETTLNSTNTWLDVDTKKMTGLVKHMPIRDEIDTPIEESLIIEFYSR